MNLFLFRLYGCKNLILGAELLACVLLPDFIINFIMESNRAFWNWISLLYIAPLCYGLTFLNRSSFALIWGCLGILEMAQFMHIVYFGVPLFPGAIRAIFYEYQDIFDPAYFKQVWFVIPILLLVYGSGFVLFSKLSEVKKNSKILSFLIIVYALSLIISDGMTFKPYDAIKIYWKEPRHLLGRCLMKTTSPSLRSTLFSVSCVGIQNLNNEKQTPYKPYRISQIPSKAKNIVLIMGESTSAQRMSLFGYHRKTTPHLDARIHDPRFLFKLSYSAAPNTDPSVMRFFNLIREPNNLGPLEKGEQNLFRRAKLNGFKTFLITTNNGSQGIGTHIDDVRSSQVLLDAYPQASYPEKLMTLKDKALPEMLRNLPLADKNFIVLHMRASHSPYEKHYADEKERFCIYPENTASHHEKLSNTYDNCMLYFDVLFENILQSFLETFRDKGESYFLFTADHSELFGHLDSETGAEVYGHGHLSLACAQVPFFMYALNAKHRDLYNRIEQKSPLSAYEIGEILLNLMGEKIDNPNQDKDIFYICESLMKNNRFIAYEKTNDRTAKIVKETVEEKENAPS